MKKMTKRYQNISKKYTLKEEYGIDKAISILKSIALEKFNASVDIAIKLGINVKKSDQMVRGSVNLPHGTGKKKKILVLCTPDKEEEVKKIGVDYVGLEEYIKKIEEGWADFDVLITLPSLMLQVGKLGKILGPKGLMPNPKTGTVTTDLITAIQNEKSGKIDFKADKAGIVHAMIGKVNFDNIHLKENILALIHTIIKMKPAAAKGNYIKKIHLSSTMSTGICIDTNNILETL